MTNNPTSKIIIKDLKKVANKDKAKILSSFFKTAKGEYGYGDIFLGITVPKQREIVKKYKTLHLKEIEKLLHSKIHEYRFTALAILSSMYTKSDTVNKKAIVSFYLKNKKHINNWDLVDTSAPNILGDWLSDKDKNILYKMAISKNLWEKRMAIISTFAFIRKNNFKDTIKIAEILLQDKHDLIHKAVGWMLREVGKRSEGTLEAFLDKHHQNMPRTMLRYAIEKLTAEKQRVYMKAKKIISLTHEKHIKKDWSYLIGFEN